MQVAITRAKLVRPGPTRPIPGYATQQGSNGTQLIYNKKNNTTKQTTALAAHDQTFY